MDEEKLSIVLDPPSNKKIINKEYKIIKKIGQGQYGKVLMGELVSKPNHYVAIKTINRVEKKKLITKTYMSSMSKIKREISIMKDCNHPNVVKLHKVIDDLKFDKILLIIEYCKFGEIDWKNYNHYYEKYHKYDSRKPLTLNKILRDVLNGLEYLHSYKNIIHRDLKPSNLLINYDNTIKISDFGVSLILENNSNDAKELARIMGTPAFYAPELCQFVSNRYSMITNEHHESNKIKIDYRIDIWSLGVTLYCLMFNDLPFNGKNEFEVCKNIVTEELKFPVIKHSSKIKQNDIDELKYFKHLLRKILVKNSNDRISLQEIKNHKFTLFNLTDNEIKRFLNFNNAIFKDADCKRELGKEDTKLPKKLKKFFSKSNNNNEVPKVPSMPPALTSKVALSSQSSSEMEKPKMSVSDLKNLQHVDDFLDSYLDSSSLESLENSDEDMVDTSNMLANLDLSNPEKHKPEPLNLIPISSHRTKSPTSIASSISTSTPTTSNIAVIGESSPSSVISFFSPSRRFFKRNKNNYNESNPTINSLSSPGSNGNNNHFDLFEPPSIFKTNKSEITERDFENGENTTQNINEKDRSSSTGFKLRKLSSSSSSLNLNAYLTDDSDTVSLRSKQRRKNGQSSKLNVNNDVNDYENEGDSTLIFGNDSEIISNIKGMDEYLNSLN